MNAASLDASFDHPSVVRRTLDMDLGDGSRDGSGRAKRICIASSGMFGSEERGSVGVACEHLAGLLAGRGHEVVIVHVGDSVPRNRRTEDALTRCAELGIAFEPIVPHPASQDPVARVAAPTWALLDWLRVREAHFDIVHVPDSRGLGYGPLLAKSLGLAFGATHFVVTVHAPALWELEGSRQLVSTERELGWVFMERRSVELADTAVCFSAHIGDWMHGAGYALPGRTFVWPCPFASPVVSPVAERAVQDGSRLEEVVFLAELEPRKGLEMFLDAIARLVRLGRPPRRVTFLGRRSPRVDGSGLIRRAARDWPIELRVLTDVDCDGAIAYLSRPGRLAVIPSLLENASPAVMECLHGRIPFIAAATGGTPELVAPEDRPRALFSPDHIALGERISELATSPLRAVRPRWDFERSLEVWARWHGQTTSFEDSARRFSARARVADTQMPLVSVCIVHRERPELVRMAVDSVYAQDYPAFEAVVVDNGSESTEALATLDALTDEFGERGWTVLRQENRHLGAARNAAAAAARGEWLLFLDDDNLLFSDAVSRLVRAARFSGADCVPASSIRFLGDGDPRVDTASHDGQVRYLGGARAWSLFRNVVGDACALVRRGAFDEVGGFVEEYRVGLDDVSFFSRLVRGDFRIEPLPDPAYYLRVSGTDRESRGFSAEGMRLRAISPRIERLADEERAFFSFAVGQADIPAPGSAPSPKMLRVLAEEAMSRRHWILAGDLWEELRVASAGRDDGYVRGAEALLNAGRLDEAEALAEEAVMRFGDRPGGYVQRAEAAMRRGDWAVASRHWEELRGAFPDQVAGYVRGAAALLNAGRPDEAEAVATEAVKRFSERPGGYVQRAEVAMRREDWEGAATRWKELRKSFPDQVPGYVRGAEALLNAGRLDEAEALAEAAVTRFGDRPGGYVQRAEVAMRRGDWAVAGKHWEELRGAFPDQVSAYVRGAAALLNAGRLDEAEALAGETVNRFGDRPGGYVQRAEVSMRRGDWAVASKRWEELRGAFPDQVPGYVRGAEALLNGGRPDEAEAVAAEAVNRFSERPGGYVQRAEIAMRREDWEGATARWKELRGAFSDQVSAYVRGAEALLNAGRLDEAEALAGETVLRFGDRPGGYVQRAEVAMRRGDWAVASKHWEELRGAFPDQVGAYVRGVTALLNAGRPDEAEAVATKAVMRFPERPGGYVQRAEVAMYRDDWEGATARWKELRAAFPDQAPGYLRGSEAAMGANRLDEAEALARESVRRYPDRVGGYLQRAEIAMRRGDWAAATERWRELRRVFPASAWGYIRGAKALLGMGRLAEAEGLANESVSRFPDRVGGYLQRAEIAMRREDWAAASEHWGELRRRFPDRAPGYVRGVEALKRADRLDEADKLANESVRRYPDRVEGYVQRAEIAMRREDWAAANGHWEELRRRFPDHAGGYSSGVVALIRAGRLDEAEELAHESVRRYPDRPGGYVRRAEIAMRRQDWMVASDRWKELRQAFPDEVRGYLRGAESLMRAGRHEEAEALTHEAAARIPDADPNDGG